ncbi:MAG: hypothetical protein K0S45_4416 [Nitrospira sp.]|nr:hypothetical protein [Nitrospira sp.]
MPFALLPQGDAENIPSRSHTTLTVQRAPGALERLDMALNSESGSKVVAEGISTESTDRIVRATA